MVPLLQLIMLGHSHFVICFKSFTIDGFSLFAHSLQMQYDFTYMPLGICLILLGLIILEAAKVISIFTNYDITSCSKCDCFLKF